MSIRISGYDFNGPFTDTDDLKEQMGVYTVLDGHDNSVVDVGMSSNVKERVENHDREDCWKRKSRGIIKFATRYSADASFCANLEDKVRREHEPPCGER